MWSNRINKSKSEIDNENDFDISNLSLNDDELDDPELLAELAGLAKQVQQPRSPVRKAVLNINDILTNVPMEDPEIDDEVDENDPDLLAELAEIAPDQNETNDTDDSTKVDDIVFVKPKMSITSDVIVEQVTEMNEPKDLTLQSLLESIKTEKAAALSKKRAGDTAGALVHLRNSKALQTRVDIMNSQQTDPLQEVVENEKAKPAIIDQRLTELHPAIDKVALSTTPQNIHHQSSVDENQLKELEPTVAAYKKAALVEKRQGNLEQAKSLLRASKLVQQELDNIKAGNPDLGVVLSPPIIESTAPLPLQNENPNLDANSVSKILDLQIKECTDLAVMLFENGDKSQAAKFHKLRAQMIAEKESLIMNSIPILEYNDFPYTVEKQNADIQIDEINVQIPFAKDIFTQENALQESSFMIDFGWPSDTITVKKETIKASGSSPKYAFSTNIKIHRTKAFQRFIERKKLTLELIQHSTAMFGMLTRRTIIGGAVVKLDELLTRSESSHIANIYDPQNPRKLSRGSVQVILKVRRPILKPEIQTFSKQWLHITAPGNLITGQPIAIEKQFKPGLSNQSAEKVEKTPNVEITNDTEELVILIQEFDE